MALTHWYLSSKIHCYHGLFQSGIFVTWLVCITVPELAKGDDCRKIEFGEQVKSKALRNHIIKSYQRVNEEMCELRCYLEPNCVSYNYGALNDGKFVCELSDTHHLQAPSSELESRDGFIYRPIDMNPCLSGPCSSKATCQAGFGNQRYRCVCPQGCYGNKCELDIKECLDGSHNCSSRAICVDVPGSFQCTCLSGYTGNGVSCKEMLECLDGSHNCSSSATCVDVPGSFQCTCQTGYTGNGTYCNDIKECLDGSHNCSSKATCIDVPGSFRCTCLSGYTGNGVICEDIKECLDGSHNCSLRATCVDVPGSFQCTCLSGYTGNGVHCNDVDECTEITHNCHSDAICTNMVGHFQCECKSSFMGNGINCTSCVLGPGALSGFCYKPVTQPQNWNNAKTHCQMLGGQLVKIESAPENEFIKNTFMTYSPATVYWIGLNDLENEGVFKWSDGSFLNNYTHWFGPNPDNFGGNENCVDIRMGLFWYIVNYQNAYWNDNRCDRIFNFICKR